MRNWHRLPIIGLGVIALAAALALIAPWGQDPVAANGTIHYVDADAMGANNGSSWADAFTELQPALDAAASGDQIWVAAGTYKPTSGTDRTISFQMKNGVAIYGGFDPTVDDDTWEERDWVDNPTILSGDIGTEGDSSDNSYHVFYHPEEYVDLDSSAVLDGFTITGGNANGGDYPHRQGGGMYNNYSSPTLRNCTFRGNSAGYGGGMRNSADYDHKSSPLLTNCTFSDNSADHDGGGMFNTYSSPTLTDCTFSGNSASYGGGMSNTNTSEPALTNCTFSDNSADHEGGGMFNNYNSNTTLTNCTFEGNSAGSGGGGMSNSDSSPTLTNCTLSENSAPSGAAIYNGGYGSFALANSILWGNSPEEIFDDLFGSPLDVTYSDVQGGFEGEGNMDEPPFFVAPDSANFHLHPCSPCIDAGDPAGEGLPPYDFEGDDRIVDGDDDGTPIVDMGVDEVAVAGTCFRVYLPLVLRAY